MELRLDGCCWIDAGVEVGGHAWVVRGVVSTRQGGDFDGNLGRERGKTLMRPTSAWRTAFNWTGQASLSTYQLWVHRLLRLIRLRLRGGIQR